jgi:hypothetical protein
VYDHKKTSKNRSRTDRYRRQSKRCGGTNDRVARYLEQYQPKLFIEFQKIAEMTSTLPSEAA